MQTTVDINENEILSLGEEILQTLLLDHTMGRNILWATKDYEELGQGYGEKDTIEIPLVTGENCKVVMPRVLKSREQQSQRSKEMAEVFTPSWVCNKQNNLVDNAWFQRENVFNEEIDTPDSHTWKPTQEKITFPEGKTWKDYVRDTRMEITCGEAPYLVSRYEEYIEGLHTPQNYRNPFLTRAMVNIKMIDTQGMGIHNMFLSQRKRSLPMPDYKKGLNETEMHMPGTVIDENYSLMLIERKDLSLTETVLLDRVQKGMPINDAALADLRKKKLIEGRKNRIMVAKEVAQVTDQKAQYTKNRGLDDSYYRELIITALEQHKQLSRPEINELLMSKLPEVLSEKQKLNKINYLLTALRKAGKIKVGKNKLWELA